MEHDLRKIELFLDITSRLDFIVDHPTEWDLGYRWSIDFLESLEKAIQYFKKFKDDFGIINFLDAIKSFKENNPYCDTDSKAYFLAGYFHVRENILKKLNLKCEDHLDEVREFQKDDEIWSIRTRCRICWHMSFFKLKDSEVKSFTEKILQQRGERLKNGSL